MPPTGAPPWSRTGGWTAHSPSPALPNEGPMKDYMHLCIAAAVLALLAPVARAADFDCVIEPRRVIELRAPLEGLIERMNVDRGDTVKRGQELVVLDTAVDRASAAIARHRSVMEGAVKSGESRLEFSKAKLERLKNLEAQKFVSAQ